VQEFVVVLAGAAALPGGLGRHHLTQHSRTSVLVAGISKFEIERGSRPFPSSSVRRCPGEAPGPGADSGHSP
jgi:hypothetical protein